MTDQVVELPTPNRRRRRRRAVVTALAVLVVAGAATAVLLLRPERSIADDTADELPPGRAEITRQTLDDTQEADGELGYGPATTVASRLPGTLTSVPADGTVIARNQALFEVDDQPVVLMYGAVPAYRPLTVDTEGTDVHQLEENLAAAGYGGFTVDEEFTAATADAVTAWQADLGLEETGVVELGRVVFAPGDVRVDSVEAELGEPLNPGAPVLAHTGTAKAVTVSLDAADQRLARQGATVRVTLPDDTVVDGTVGEVATVIQPGDGQDQEPTTLVEVVVALADQQAVAAYELASVDVTFVAEQRPDVLAVPVAALVALAEGGFGVEVIEDGRTRYVPVTTGLFADGLVEISGDGIAEGMTVGMPE